MQIIIFRPLLASAQSKQEALQSLSVELNRATLMVLTIFYKILNKSINFGKNFKMLK